MAMSGEVEGKGGTASRTNVTHDANVRTNRNNPVRLNRAPGCGCGDGRGGVADQHAIEARTSGTAAKVLMCGGLGAFVAGLVRIGKIEVEMPHPKGWLRMRLRQWGPKRLLCDEMPQEIPQRHARRMMTWS